MTITEKIDNITHIPEEYMQAAAAPPRSVKIELVGRCNYRCGFCALRTREKQPKQDMDFELFKRVTAEMRRAGVEEIGVFYIGESFMNPELLVKAIRWCKKKLEFPYVFLTSNASLATPNVVRRIMNAGLDSLKWSVNAADDEQFERVMGVSARMQDKAFENIREAKRIRDEGKYPCGLYASSIRYDGDQQERMKAVIEEKVAPFTDETYELPLYSMASMATQREKELGYRPTAGNQGRINALVDPLPCWSAFTEGHLRSDGILTACCFDSDGTFGMADLNEVSFMEGWNSPAFQALRKAHLKKDVTGTICESCVIY